VILNDVSMQCSWGALHGILGPSGAGKSTLLNFISGRTLFDLECEGDTTINDVPVDRATLAKELGHLEQNDFLFPTETARESLTFCATCFYPELSPEAINEEVSRLISILMLGKCEHTIIGYEGMKGLSGGEKRRVSIGHRLLANPEILILDEPTSGLDFATSHDLVLTLKDLAKAGMSIVATFHQPSVDISDQFDTLSLLANGRMVFSGPIKCALDFFAGKGHPCPTGRNPSDHFLTVLIDEKLAMQFADANVHGKNETKSISSVDLECTVVCVGKNATCALHHDRKKFLIDFRWFGEVHRLLSRRLKQTLRDRVKVLYGMLGLQAILALLLALIFVPLPSDAKSGVYERASLMFWFCTIVGMPVSYESVYVHEGEKLWVQKEIIAKWYSPSAFFVAKLVTTAILDVLFGLVSSLVPYWLVGLRSGAMHFFIFFSVATLLLLISRAWGLFCSSVTSSMRGAFSLSYLILLFSGVSGFLTTETPVFLLWCRWVSWYHYSSVILLRNELEGNQFQDGDEWVDGSTLIPSSLSNRFSTGENAVILLVILGFLNLVSFLSWVIKMRQV